MSPVVKHKRPSVPGRRATGITRGSMLFFASLSSGIAALIVGFVVLITIVGAYAVLIWPLTFWDLANLSLERYGGWTASIALSVFAGGALAGFWVFSGGMSQFKQKAALPGSAHAARNNSRIPRFRS